MNNGTFINATGIWYRNEINTIKKKADVPLQPIFEAFMNAWESILDRFSKENFRNGSIEIILYCLKNLFSDETGSRNIEKIVVGDNGIGLDYSSYQRLVNLRDDTKKHSNLGTGRIQYIHFFDKTTIDSIYKDGDQYKKRKVTLSQ